MPLTDLMIDLETFNNTPDAAIATIGLVLFSRTDDEVHTFSVGIKPASVAGSMGVETVLWWLTQESSARNELMKQMRRGVSEKAAAQQIVSFLEDLCDLDRIRVWGNGASFDLPILESLFRRVGLPIPWKFYNHRCYRTFKQEFKQVTVPPLTGHIAHDALSDAIQQTRHIKAIFEHLSAGVGKERKS